jgi:hypothetical protein
MDKGTPRGKVLPGEEVRFLKPMGVSNFKGLIGDQQNIDEARQFKTEASKRKILNH